MPEGALLLLLVTLQRVLELGLSARNTRRLLQLGAVEVAAGHYPLIVALHAGWFAGLWTVVLWTDAAGYQVLLPWLVVYLLLQLFRVWILVSLGARWTTRILVLDAPLVRRGPYRFLRHPNYLLVVLEIAVVPLALGLPWLALIFSLLNFGVLFVRIRAEDRALADLRSHAGSLR